MSQDFELVTKEGTQFVIMEDVDGEGDEAHPIAVMFVTCPMDGHLALDHLSGIELEEVPVLSYNVKANGALTAEEARQLADALLRATRPLSERERAIP